MPVLLSFYFSYHLSIICHHPQNISQDQDQLSGLCQHTDGSWPLHFQIDEPVGCWPWHLQLWNSWGICIFNNTFKLQSSPGAKLSSSVAAVTASYIFPQQSHGDSSFVQCLSETQQERSWYSCELRHWAQCVQGHVLGIAVLLHPVHSESRDTSSPTTCSVSLARVLPCSSHHSHLQACAVRKGKEKWCYCTEDNTSTEMGFSGSSPDGRLTKPSRWPHALPCGCQVLGTKWESSWWSWGLYWWKLVCLPGRNQMSHFPEHAMIQAIGGDPVTSFFDHNFLKKYVSSLHRPLQLYVSCSLALLLPLFNFYEISFSHTHKTLQHWQPLTFILSLSFFF